MDDQQVRLNRTTMEFEEKIGYLQEKDQKTIEKARSLGNENELLKAEMKNLFLKHQVLERRVGEGEHLESAFLELQRDYDELVKEKAAVIQEYENQIFYLKDEGREAKGTVVDTQKAAVRARKEAEEMQRECMQAEREKGRLEKEVTELAGELAKRERTLEEKSRRLEEYAEEIAAINRKILEFNVLMERLIQENQRLSIVAGEGANGEKLSAQERRALEKAKAGSGERELGLKASGTLKNFRQENWYS